MEFYLALIQQWIKMVTEKNKLFLSAAIVSLKSAGKIRPWTQLKLIEILHYIIVIHSIWKIPMSTCWCDNAALPSIDHTRLYLISVWVVIQISRHLIIFVVLYPLCYYYEFYFMNLKK